MTDALLDALDGVEGLAVLAGERLGRHNLLRVGGPVDLWLVAETEQAATQALGHCRASGVKVRVLSGEHWLARDEGLEGACLVLGRCARAIDATGEGLRVGGRVLVAVAAEAAARAGLTGLEELAGRPGTVAEAIDAGQLTGPVVRLRVLRGSRASTVSPAKRKASQPIIHAELALRPEAAETVAAHATEARRGVGERPGRLMADLPRQRAADLIVDAGLPGVRLRAVRVGRYEPNSLVNLGGATARDVALVVAMVRDRVKLRTGAELRLHPPHLGRAQTARATTSRSRR